MTIILFNFRLILSCFKCLRLILDACVSCFKRLIELLQNDYFCGLRLISVPLLPTVARDWACKTNLRRFLLFSLFLLRYPFIHLCAYCCLLHCVCTYDYKWIELLSTYFSFLRLKITLAIFECLCILF